MSTFMYYAYVLGYYAVVGAVLLYVLFWFLALVLGLLTPAFADRWTRASSDSRRAQWKVLRNVEPREILVIGRGIKPSFPVIQESGINLTVAGLNDKNPGMTKNSIDDWAVITNRNSAYDLIQSKWSYMSPIYLFRKLAFKSTGRHVVAIWFPFIVAGFTLLYEPITMRFQRARPKKQALPQGSGMEVLEEVNSAVQVVIDTTDHVLHQFPLRIITETFPTTSGLSLRADVTTTYEVVNVLKLVSWRDWSTQVWAVVSNATASYFRGGDLDEVYAVKKDGAARSLQDLISEHLTKGAIHPFRDGNSVLEELGLKLLHVTLNDLIPGDEKQEAEINRIMSITTEGKRKAEAAGAMLKAQLEPLKDVEPHVAQALGAITAAQQAGQGKGKIDYIIGGGSSGPTVDQAVFNKIIKALEDKE